MTGNNEIIYDNSKDIDGGPYATGKLITLKSRSPSAVGQLTVLILRTIIVGIGRSSQTVIVQVSGMDGTDETNKELVAKFFDPYYCTPDEGEFDGSAKEYMKYQHTNEVKSYEKMKHPQGDSIPQYFGDFEYMKDNDECVGLILLEYISLPLIESVHEPNEVEILESSCKHFLDRMHSCGVIHNDIAARNMF